MTYLVAKIEHENRPAWGVVRIHGNEVKRVGICVDEETALLLATALAGRAKPE